MAIPQPMNKLENLLYSPANWCGLALAALALAPLALGVPVWGGWLLAPVGYGIGFAGAGLAFGWPRLRSQAWDALEFEDRRDDERQGLHEALAALRQLVDANPEERLAPGLQSRVLELCNLVQTLLLHWERSRGQLSLEESFHVRHIVLRYLPEALKTYLAIPPRFARSKVLDNGRTAEEILGATVDDLTLKVLQLTDDLVKQDAEAFLNHSRFLEAKFRTTNPLKSR